MRFLITIHWFLVSLLPQSAIGQIEYKVVDVPQAIVTEIPDIKKSLNEALKKLTVDNDKSAFSIINERLRVYKNLPLRLRKQTGDGQFKYIVYHVSVPGVAQTRLVDIKATKDLIDETIYRQYQFASSLADTVAVLDTLRLRIFPADFNLKITGYVLRFKAGGETFESELSSEDANTLLLCPEDLPEHGRTFACTLLHKDSRKELATFGLHFLNDTAQVELRGVAEALEENGNGISDYILHLQVYGKASWGRMQVENIRRWLRKEGIE